MANKYKMVNPTVVWEMQIKGIDYNFFIQIIEEYEGSNIWC